MAGGGIHKDISRLDILTHEATFVSAAKRSRQSDGESLEPSELHGRADEAVERLAARGLEYHRGLPAIAHEL